MLDQNDLQEIGKMIAASEEKMNHNLQLLIENYFEPKFKTLAEGHELLLETMVPKSRVEALEEDVAFLRTVVTALNKEVAELKKAI